MADEQHEVRSINWTRVFGFSEIFKGFRMAIHPSKLLLALAAIVLVFASGWVLDQFWSMGGSYVYKYDAAGARSNEIVDYFRLTGERFDRKKTAIADSRLARAANELAQAKQEAFALNKLRGKLSGTPSTYFQQAFSTQLAELNSGKTPPPDTAASILQDAKDKDRSWSSILSDTWAELSVATEKGRAIAEKAYDAAIKAIDESSLTDDQKSEEKDKVVESWRLSDRALSERGRDHAEAVRKIRGDGIFESFLGYQWECVKNAVKSVTYLNFTGGLDGYRRTVRSRAIQPIATAEDQPFGATAAVPPTDSPGFLFWVLMAANGWFWLLGTHWVFAAVILFISLAVWALFGGAIYRIAALQATRDEKISACQALRFSAGKFMSFFTAPLIPVVIILACGFLLFLGGLVINFPIVGEIIAGLLFFLALLLGLAIAFMTVGLVAGAGLMYPTIAVEGSDSFDAISRSFSYVFARPFRTIVYSLVALVYGVLTYLFVRLFAFLMLATTHYFVGWGVFIGGDSISPNADKLDVLWTAPTFDCLWGRFSWAAMSGGEMIGAFIIGIWVFVIAALVVSYMLTYFASSSTLIYLLLRRKVDATDLDDVYIEESEEELIETGQSDEAPVEQVPTDETPADDADKKDE